MPYSSYSSWGLGSSYSSWGLGSSYNTGYSSNYGNTGIPSINLLRPQSNNASSTSFSEARKRSNLIALGRWLALTHLGIPADNDEKRVRYLRALAKNMGIGGADSLSEDDLYFSIGANIYESTVGRTAERGKVGEVGGELDSPDKFVGWVLERAKKGDSLSDSINAALASLQNTWKAASQSIYTGEMTGELENFLARAKEIYQGGYRDFVDQSALELQGRSIELQERANALGLFRTLGALERQKQQGARLSEAGRFILGSSIEREKARLQSLYDIARNAVLQKEFAAAKQAALSNLQQQFQTKAQIIGTNLNIDLSKIQGIRDMFNIGMQLSQLQAEREAAQRQLEEAKRQAEEASRGAILGTVGTILGGAAGALFGMPQLGAAIGGGLMSLFSGGYTGYSAGVSATSGLTRAFPSVSGRIL